jgi:hypothetical protein
MHGACSWRCFAPNFPNAPGAAPADSAVGLSSCLLRHFIVTQSESAYALGEDRSRLMREVALPIIISEYLSFPGIV